MFGSRRELATERLSSGSEYLKLPEIFYFVESLVMDIFVARQPIFDRQQKVYAYELLFRSNAEQNIYNHSDGDHSTVTLLNNSFFSIGMDTLTRGRPAFINFTKKLLVDEIPAIFPRELTVIEILESVEPDEKVLNACLNLKDLGYLLVLDDFVFEPKFEALIELVDIIKIDFLSTQGEDRAKVVKDVGNKRIKYLAEKVETQPDFEEALELGYSYFQGYYFSKPRIISSKEVPTYKLNYLRILKEINQPEVDFSQLEQVFKQDLSLSYKLLNYINSAHFGLRNKIKSIKHALALLGVNECKKWLSFIVMSCIGKDKSEELIALSLIRANSCEMIAPIVEMEDRASELFLMGLFSMIDALLDQPLEQILAKLPLAEDVKRGLLGKKNHFRDVYELVVSFEKGDWQNFSNYVVKLDVNPLDLSDIFIRALEKANQNLSA